MTSGKCEKGDFLEHQHIIEETATDFLLNADERRNNEKTADDHEDSLALLSNGIDGTEVKIKEVKLQFQEDKRKIDGREGEGGGREPSQSRGNMRVDFIGYFHRYRDLVAYWWLGFCNNFTYWVMITAAYDLLTPDFQGHTERSHGETKGDLLQLTGRMSEANNSQPTHVFMQSSWENKSSHYITNTFECQDQSTGVILVADTLPATALTLAGPLTFFMPVSVRVWLVILLCGSSYLTLGLAHPKFVFLGVALASASRGFSDSAFLSHASQYPKIVLSMWSSGTGIATFIGPLLYSSLTTGGLDPSKALLIFLAIPIVTAVSFWCLLSHPEDPENMRDEENQGDATRLTSEQDLVNEKQTIFIVIKEKLLLFKRSLKYTLPLGIFYFIMYFTNQGLLELVYFPASVLTHAQQYSWSNTVRCLGTLISRSAHTVMLCPTAWIYNSAALVILCIVGSEAYYHYLPSEYIIFILLLIQGLLEGAAFRTCLFNIHNATSEADRTFCLAMFPSSLFLPALSAGLVSMPVHNVLCKHHAFKL